MLLKFQNSFLDYVSEQGGASELQEVVDSRDISVKARLGIYKNNIIQNLTSALRIVYPKFIVLVGEEFFEFLAYEFIKQNLPSSGVLLEYGREFGDFIENVESLRDYPYAGDFARFEWLNHECHHAIEEKVVTLLDVAKAMELDADYIPSIKSCVRVFHSQYPILQLWDMCVNNAEQALEPKETFVMLNKNEQVVGCVEISSKELDFLRAFPNLEDFEPKEASEIVKRFCEMGVFKL